jgi:shikimate kinase
MSKSSHHIIIEGMCYSGKTTLGRLVAEKLNKTHLDFGDVFKKVFGLKETEYLAEHGKEKFAKLEKKMMYEEFENIDSSVISVSGSAMYYTKAMTHITNKGTVIFLDVPFEEINKRMNKEGEMRAIVFPDGINNFEELYNERRKLYLKYADTVISVNCGENEETVLNRIINTLKTNINTAKKI